MLRPQQNRLLFRPFDLHAVGLNAGIIFQRLMDDTAIEGVEWLSLDDISPPAYFFGSVHGFLDECFASLRAIAAYIDHHLGRGRILLK